MNEHAGHDHGPGIPDGTPITPAWALLVGIVGRSSVVAAGLLFALSLLLAFVPRPFAGKGTKIAFGLGTLGLIVAITSLGTLFVTDQFAFQYVFNHSDARNALQYKIAAIWTAQEGSFLLWGLASSIFGFWALLRSGEFARPAAGAMALFLAGICAILYRETPFGFLNDVVQDGKVFLPPNGNGLTPSLQNYWVAIHPPTIFSGFGLLIVPFALGVAGVLKRDLTGWIPTARPFALWGVAILGLGISMGGLWAYETQGWGGFWAWDPVENVSLVPWLFLVGLTHGLLIQARTNRGSLITLVLAGLPFLAFVYGTFLTRSGLLDKVSVHSFASMDKAALQILRGMLIGLALGYVAYVWQAVSLAKSAPAPVQPERPPGYDRGQAYAAGIVLISLIAVVVAVGMSWPVLQVLRGGEGSRIEEPVYHKALVWFFIPLMSLMAVGPFLTWKAELPKETWRRVMNSFSISLGLLGLSIFAMKIPGSGIVLDATRRVEGPFGLLLPQLAVIGLLFWLCLFVLVANTGRIQQGLKRSKMTLGGFVSHIGIAVLLGGLLLSHGLERKERVFVREGAPSDALGYRFEYKGLSRQEIDDRDNKVLISVTGPNGRSFEARPGLYYYPGQEGQMTAMVWPHIERSLTHDVYLSLREPITEVFAEPVKLKPGETKTQDGITLTYIQPTSSGVPGQPGAKFGAVVRISQGGKSAIAKPELELTPEGPLSNLVQAGDDFKLAMGTISPADKSITLRAFLSPPIYPIELFEKPLTSLVWFGTGIFTFGGAMSAFARRLRRPVRVVDEAPVADRPVPNVAPLPTS